MDETAPLCESCGYALSGLPESAACPECGRLVSSSLPAARPGTPWQRRSNPATWFRTMWCVLRHPKRTFQELRIARGTTLLLVINLVIAGLAIADPWVGALAGDPARGAWRLRQGSDAVRHLVTLAVEGAIVAVVLFALTYVEYAGIRFFARTRGWRLTNAAAWQICAHASVGWILSGVLAIVSLAAMFTLVNLFGLAPTGEIDLNPSIPGKTGVYGLVGVAAPAAGYFAGLLVFEILVHAGVRQCKYAARAE